MEEYRSTVISSIQKQNYKWQMGTVFTTTILEKQNVQQVVAGSLDYSREVRTNKKGQIGRAKGL